MTFFIITEGFKWLKKQLSGVDVLKLKLWEISSMQLFKATLLGTISLIKNTQCPFGVNLSEVSRFLHSKIKNHIYWKVLCLRASISEISIRNAAVRRLRSDVRIISVCEVQLGCAAIEDEHLPVFIFNLLTDLFSGTLGNSQNVVV